MWAKVLIRYDHGLEKHADIGVRNELDNNPCAYCPNNCDTLNYKVIAQMRKIIQEKL